MFWKHTKAKAPEEQAYVVSSLPFWLRYRGQLIAAILILLVLAGGSVWIWRHYEVQHNAKTKSDQQFSQLTSETNHAETTSQFNQTAGAWISFAEKTTNRSQQITAYTDAAALYLNSSQYTKVLGICNESEKVDGITFALSEGCAYAAKALNEKSTAIKYYQDAIRLIPSKVGDKGEEISSFNMAVQQLQAKS